MKARATPTDLRDFITAHDRLFFFPPASATHENEAVGRKRQGDRAGREGKQVFLVLLVHYKVVFPRIGLFMLSYPDIRD